MKRIFLLGAFMATMALGVNAQAPAKVPAYPGIIDRTQPNGYVLHTFNRGDERKHWIIIHDGWQILENKKGWYKYAKLNRKGEVVITLRKVHNADDRSKCETRWLEKHGVKKN